MTTKRVFLLTILILILSLFACRPGVAPTLGPTPTVTEEEDLVVEEEEITEPLPAPAAFLVSDLSVQPQEVEPKESVSVTVSVVNTGGIEGSYTVVLTINSVKEAERNVTIAGGNTEDVIFTVTKEEAESYSVVVDGLIASFTVVAPVKTVTPTPKPSPPPSPTSGNWSPMTSGTTASFMGVWGSSSSDVFAVGSGGTIQHYDGSTWETMTSDTTTDLRGVWGSSSSDVFAVGGGFDVDEIGSRILHYDGSTWRKYRYWATCGISSLWCSSPSDVFIAGSSSPIYIESPVFDDGNIPQFEKVPTGRYREGFIRHYDGTTWRNISPWEDYKHKLLSVWGSSSSDVFAVGERGKILHYDGSKFREMTSGTTKTLLGVWYSSSSDVFAVGSDGTILHYKGSTWEAMTSNTTKNLLSIWGSSSSDVFAVGADAIILHYDGSIWEAMTSNTTKSLSDIWGSSSSDVFAVGSGGTILHYEK